MDEKIRILVVEDSKLAQAIYDELLLSKFFEKHFVDDGESALEIYKEWNPHIILLDIMLPVMSGYSVLKIIRNDYKDIDTTIIMLTALSKKDDILDCFKLGIQGYIVKPPDHDSFMAKVLEYYSKISYEDIRGCYEENQAY